MHPRVVVLILLSLTIGIATAGPEAYLTHAQSTAADQAPLEASEAPSTVGPLSQTYEVYIREQAGEVSLVANMSSSVYYPCELIGSTIECVTPVEPFFRINYPLPSGIAPDQVSEIIGDSWMGCA